LNKRMPPRLNKFQLWKLDHPLTGILSGLKGA
jgi:hypothetical protein